MSQDYRDPDERYVREDVRRFKRHLITYVCVVALLFLIDVLSGGFWHGHFWFFWIAAIWGILIVLQAARLFGDDIGRDWENRTVERILARRRVERGPPPSYTPPPPPSPPPRGPVPPAP